MICLQMFEEARERLSQDKKWDLDQVYNNVVEGTQE